MFKKIVLGLAVLSLMFTASASAIDLQLGAEIEGVLHRTLVSDTLDTINSMTGLGMEIDYSAQYYDVTVETKIGDWLVVTPKAGIQHCAAVIETNIPFFGDIDLNGGIGWNLGIDAEAVVYKDVVDVAIIGGYRFSRTDLDEIEIGGMGLTIDNPIETIFASHEWEIGAKVSKDLKELIGCPVIPSVGLVYSDLSGELVANLSAVEFTDDISAADNLGLRLGIAGEPIEDLLIGLDVKLLDQTAIGGSVSYLF